MISCTSLSRLLAVCVCCAVFCTCLVQQLARLFAHEQLVTGHGMQVLLGMGSELVIVDADAAVRQPVGGPVTAISVAPEGQYVACCTGNAQLTVQTLDLSQVRWVHKTESTSACWQTGWLRLAWPSISALLDVKAATCSARPGMQKPSCGPT